MTDRHPVHARLRSRFAAQHRRVASIVLDVLFDHYLTRHWDEFCAWQRRGFMDGVYAVLLQPPAPLPEALAAVAPRWVEADWLSAYESRQGVAAVLARLNRRSRSGLDLVAAFDSVLADESALEAGFLEIFGDVQRATNRGQFSV